MTRIIVGDIESTGLGTDAGIVEIAWIELNDSGETKASFHSLIDPGIPIPHGASAIHGITDAMVTHEPTIEEFMQMHNYPLQEGEIILVAHNAAFDFRFFGKHIKNALTPCCTLRLARHIYPDADNHKLSTLRYYLDLAGAHKDAHSAMGDVKVLHALLARMGQDTGLSFTELHELANSNLPVRKMPFGKHKGVALAALDSNYVKWLLTKCENLDENLRFSLNNL